jgi:hypothetical protein
VVEPVFRFIVPMVRLPSSWASESILMPALVSPVMVIVEPVMSILPVKV